MLLRDALFIPVRRRSPRLKTIIHEIGLAVKRKNGSRTEEKCGAVNMITIRVTATASLAFLLLPMMIIGCQFGFGAQPAPTPVPPPLPVVKEGHVQTGWQIGNNTKVIDGVLHVWYIPCEPVPAEWVAPIRLTDLRSGSYIYLNGDGTVNTKPDPDYKTKEGQIALESALKDSSLMEQVLTIPECMYRPIVQQRDGWPAAYEEDIGDPPMPKVAMAISKKPATSPGQYIYPGWRGAYCWPVSGGSRECEDTAIWEGFVQAEAILSGSDTTIYFTVLGDNDNLGRISRIQMLPALEKWSLRKLGRELNLGTEIHSVEAKQGETLEEFVVPELPGGIYMLITSYESPLGEVEHAFKVVLSPRRTN